MDKKASQEAFARDYNPAFGTAVPRPLVPGLEENKHGVDNPVIDLNINNLQGEPLIAGEPVFTNGQGKLVSVRIVPVENGGTNTDNAADARANLNTVADPGGNGLLARISAHVTAARTLRAGTGILITDGDGVAGDPVITCTVSPTGSDSEPITNGDPASPELIFAYGDVVMS